MASTPLIVFGITGRMGQSLINALREGSPFRLQGAIASAASSRLGQDAALEGEASGIKITAEPSAVMARGAVALDFSLSHAVAAHARACAGAGVPLLVGATGFDAAATAQLERAAKTVAVLVAPNTSIGVAVLLAWRLKPPGFSARATMWKFPKRTTVTSVMPPQGRH